MPECGKLSAFFRFSLLLILFVLHKSLFVSSRCMLELKLAIYVSLKSKVSVFTCFLSSCMHGLKNH